MKEELIYPFNNNRFFEAWALWLNYRKEIKKPIRGTISEQAQLVKLSRLASTPDEAIGVIMQSIENNWQGLFQLKNKSNARTNETTASAFEQFWA